jgi:alpha-beta hydrolase superfamily lysophospholipase
MKPWLKCILIFIIIIALMWLALLNSRENQTWKNTILSLFDKFMIKSKHAHIKEHEKNTDEWKWFDYHGESLPYLHLSTSTPTPTSKTLLICHGAGLPLEYCYDEYKAISKRHQFNIISLEYPGFGKRAQDKITEYTLLKKYPQEVIFLLSQHLKIPWEQTILLGQCFGAIIAVQIASLPDIATRLDHLYLTKPMPSIRSIIADNTAGLLNHVVPNLLNLGDETLDRILTNVTCIHPEKDAVCRLKRTRELMTRFKNAKTTKLYIVPNATHGMKMIDALDALEQLKGI